MKIFLKSKENPHNLMRRCGYYYERTDEQTGEPVFIRRAGSSDYPRFHIYVHSVKSREAGISPKAKLFNRVKTDNVSREIIINLHLDQKRPVYKGVSAHAGERSGVLVEKEAERIKQVLGP